MNSTNVRTLADTKRRDGYRAMAVAWGSALDFGHHFYDSRFMESRSAVTALGALAQDSRLQVYRLLVQAGPEGLAASDIAERLGIPANTLSFHLKTLSHAALVHSRQEGRFVYYSTNYEQMNALLGFLTENCCGGRSCVPAAVVARKRKTS
jgi:ArsR family transcriptional regulator